MLQGIVLMINKLQFSFIGQWSKYLWVDTEDTCIAETADQQDRRSGCKRAASPGTFRICDEH